MDSCGTGGDATRVKLSLAQLVSAVLMTLSYAVVAYWGVPIYGFCFLLVETVLLEASFREQKHLIANKGAELLKYLGCALYILVAWSFWISIPTTLSTARIVSFLVLCGTAIIWTGALVSRLTTRFDPNGR